MSPVWSLLATAMALAHVALIALLIVGGPMTLPWPRMMWIHVPAIVATGAVFLVGADCPLTTWHKFFLERAGSTPYEGGFVEHFIVEPLTGSGITSLVNVLIVSAWVAPTVAAYVLLARQRTIRNPTAGGVAHRG